MLSYIKKVNLSIEGQIWLELSGFANCAFTGVYIPPEDSPYFDPSLFGFLMSKVIEYPRVIVLRDLNARVAEPEILDENNELYTYQEIKDFVMNNHIRQLVNV